MRSHLSQHTFTTDFYDQKANRTHVGYGPRSQQRSFGPPVALGEL